MFSKFGEDWWEWCAHTYKSQMHSHFTASANELEILPLVVNVVYEFTNLICMNIFAFAASKSFGISVMYKFTDLL